MTTLQDLTSMSHDQLIAKVRELEAAKNKVRFKVSEKGAVSVYGIHSRFPVTLYANQWERLLTASDAIRKFIADNHDGLSTER